MDSSTLFLIRLSFAIGLIAFFGYFALYSGNVLKKAERSQKLLGKVYYTLFGDILREANLKLNRTVNLDKKSKTYKVYRFFDDIIVNLELKKDNVTVLGLIIFILVVSAGLALLFGYLISDIVLTIPMFIAIFYLVLNVFKLLSLLKYETREAEIMDAVDLLVSDIRGGVYNAISRYQNSFHPNIRPYFLEFLDDIRNKNYNFKDAMLILNNKLGPNFNDFTQKAITYELKADKTLDDIFSTIIETNRKVRELREMINIKFQQLKMQFFISLVLIGGYALFTTITEPYIVNVLFNTTFGKLLIIFDVVLVAGVLSYLTTLKTKSL